MKHPFLFPVSLSLCLAWGTASARDITVPEEKKRPHIVFILADDPGIGDIGRYHEYFTGTDPVVPTPNLNRLFDEGMAFTDARLPASLCAPNRFSILTGSYPFRSRTWGTWNPTASTGLFFGERIEDRIDNPHLTIGGALQSAGYRTAFLGKMHLGGDFFDGDGNLLRMLESDQLHQIDFSRRFRNGLLDHGFDYTFVSPDGIQGPLYLWFENDLYRPVSEFQDKIDGVADGPPSELRSFFEGDRVGLGKMIVDGFGDSRFDTSEHGAIMVHFAGEFVGSHLREHPDQPFMLFFATPAIHEPYTPAAPFQGTSGFGPRADVVMDLDHQVGEVIGILERNGILDETLVIFASDNGAVMKGSEAMVEAGQHPNGPFLGNKGRIYEGGVRVPLILRWGDGTEDHSVIAPGLITDQHISVLDLIPTLIHIAGGTPQEDQHLDSSCFLRILLSRHPDSENPIRQWHWHRGEVMHDRIAARMDDEEGEWVWIRPTGNLPMELFNLAKDISQTTNLLEGYFNINGLPDDHPHAERVRKMNNWLRINFRTSAPRTQAFHVE